MLEPREADIPALFLCLVVLPLVTYIILGKWNEASKKNAWVNRLAHVAAEEARTAETMTVADTISPAALLQTGLHVCARCFGPATTRCSRCKTVRYCSGKCQIIHWRLGHKEECQKWGNGSLKVFTASTKVEMSCVKTSAEVNRKSLCLPKDVKDSKTKVIATVKESKSNCNASDSSSEQADTPCSNLESERLDSEEMDSHEHTGPSLRLQEGASCCFEKNKTINTIPLQASSLVAGSLTNIIPTAQKSGNDHCAYNIKAQSKKNSKIVLPAQSCSSRNNSFEKDASTVQPRSASESCSPAVSTPHHDSSAMHKTDLDLASDNFKHSGNGIAENLELHPAEKVPIKFRKPPYTIDPSCASQNLAGKPLINILNSTGRKPCTDKGNYISFDPPSRGSDGIPTDVQKKISSQKKLQKPLKNNVNGIGDGYKSNKVLFRYEDLVDFFKCEIFDLYPRGLLNCGNSCYANAVLQSLTCTKPLAVYLLRQIHSRSCCAKDWCLMCELELHVSMLRENGGPLSPGRLLMNMRNIGCQIGGGSQEDAHEFLRLLVMSMQSVCLEVFGGEKEVHPKLQETTLIQQIFGGRLRSKVKCLRCQSESERYENMMDLTLEIHGWVESLQDALTQFTAPEDLDGDNMYRCGRCCTYVKARKQLIVHEAPNILTIVLKRFQTGKYGKINKCVTFPEMLDMIPYMTGSSDSPPLYMLYAVVVHLDTFNASFSGHYISYVKDFQGSWFRIDDTEVQSVPLTQVMSEGAYMLFYSRSFPRPPRAYYFKSVTTEVSTMKHATHRPPKSSRHGMNNQRADPNDGLSLRSESSACNIERDVPKGSIRGFRRNGCDLASPYMDFPDAGPSDWSLFTSSDEASFTTESTSDSFSTIDHSDAANLDPISSLFSPLYIPEYSHRKSVPCTKL